MSDDDQPTMEDQSPRRSGDEDFAPAQPLTGAIPKQVGKYHIRKLIATGGMGSVYQAVQEQPRRNVALKLMKAGIASRSALRRFEYEAQLLARLRHPNIAEIFDAGTHDSGEGGMPYFVMEYIPGAKRITDYAKEKKLGTNERLKLYLDVCAAVHHGHTKGIIHRDLKPDNILVDSHGRVKVIDFGVARATDSDLAITTLQTDIGQLIGTVQYMSPEQVEADPDDLDTRSDVYSLGVVLYELLTERLPYDVKTMKVYEATRVIRETEALRLSATNAALRGDVDTIVLKALEKDRERRYQTAQALADDIQRYLSNEPITARPPSLTYQLSTFARRNKAVVGGVAAVFVALLAGLIVSLILYQQAEQARQDAESARLIAEQKQQEAEAAQAAEAEQRRIAQQQSQRAQQEAAAVKAVSEFLFEDVIGAADPEKETDRNITLRAVIDRAAASIGTQFADVPLVEAAIRHRLGVTYRNLGESKTSLSMLQRAVELYREHLGEEHPDTLMAIEDAMFVTAPGGIGVVGGYGEKLDELLAIRQRVLGEEHPDTLRTKFYKLTNSLVTVRGWGAVNEIESQILQIIELQKKVLGDNHRDVLNSSRMLAFVYTRQGRLDAALSLHERLLATQKAHLGPDHPDTLASMSLLAMAYQSKGRVDEAQELLEEALERTRRVVGDGHPNIIGIQGALAAIYSETGRYADAVPLFEDYAQRMTRMVGENHLATKMGNLQLAAAYMGMGRRDEALRLWDKIMPNAVGDGAENKGLWYVGTRSMSQALRMTVRAGRYEDALALQQRMARWNAEDTIEPMRLGVLYLLSGDASGHREHCRAQLARYAESQEAGDLERAAKTYLIHPAEAEPQLLQQAVDMARRAWELGKDDRAAPWYELCLGIAEYRMGQYDAAITHLDQAQGGEVDERRAAALAYAAMAEHQRGRSGAARAKLDEATALVESLLNPEDSEPTSGWHDILIARIALDEARALINSSTSPASR